MQGVAPWIQLGPGWVSQGGASAAIGKRRRLSGEKTIRRERPLLDRDEPR